LDLTEFLAAVLIALYAMIGGVFLSAAITAPDNCQKLLRAGRQTISQSLYYGIACLGAALIATFAYWPNSDLVGNPLLWMATAHIALYLTFWGCQRIVKILLDESPSEQREHDAKLDPRNH
jgi:hypothetical protein